MGCSERHGGRRPSSLHSEGEHPSGAAVGAVTTELSFPLITSKRQYARPGNGRASWLGGHVCWVASRRESEASSAAQSRRGLVTGVRAPRFGRVRSFRSGDGRARRCEGEESFEFVVCTPRWFDAQPFEKGFAWPRHHLFLKRLDYATVERAIGDVVRRAEGEDWSSVASQIARYGGWEFEDYRE
jgi:hypothetical protein